MKRARFLQFALLIARRSSAWAHEVASSPGVFGDVSTEAVARFDADIRYGLDRLKDAPDDDPDPEGTSGIGGGG